MSYMDEYYPKREEASPKLSLVKVALASAILIVGGCRWIQKLENKFYENPTIVRVKDSDEEFAGNKRTFEAGEHTVSTHLERPDNSFAQYPTQPGYRIVSVDVDSWGSLAVYENIEPVVCESTGIDKEDEYVYTEFGTPVVKKEVTQEDGCQIFEPYEHILLTPISDPRYDNVQYLDIEGYELVGVTYYEFGRYSQYGGSWALYTNTTTVKCEEKDGKCLDFGTPVDLEKEDVKTLVK